MLGRRLRVRTTERDDRPGDVVEPEQEERQRDLLRDRLSAAEVDAARSAPLTKLAESELGASNMVFGAAATGERVFTTSSSPGISLKQEGISYMAGSEVPGVIVNMSRSGPGLGGIHPSQGDYFQATRGGGHQFVIPRFELSMKSRKCSTAGIKSPSARAFSSPWLTLRPDMKTWR